MGEYVDAKAVIRAVRRSEPGITTAEIARRISRDEKRVWYLENKQVSMSIDVAEHILHVFDLTYLLYTGDIEIWDKRPYSEAERAARAQQRRGKMEYDHEAKLRRERSQAHYQAKHRARKPRNPIVKDS